MAKLKSGFKVETVRSKAATLPWHYPEQSLGLKARICKNGRPRLMMDHEQIFVGIDVLPKST